MKQELLKGAKIAGYVVGGTVAFLVYWAIAIVFTLYGCRYL